MSGSCVITNEDGWLKRGSTRSDLCRPKFTLMNPRLTYTLPEYQTESGCVDILLHTMERYFVNIETMEITDSISESLMQTVIYNARILLNEPGNYNARAEIMWAGSLSHNGLTGCGTGGGDWACHQLEHELGGTVTMLLMVLVLLHSGEAGHVMFMMPIRNVSHNLPPTSSIFHVLLIMKTPHSPV